MKSLSQHENIQVEDDGFVRTIRFARPEKKNAITVAMYVAVNAAIEDAAADDGVRVLRWASSGGHFTAGNDLMDFMKDPPERLEDSPVGHLLRNLLTFPKPMVSSVDGVAVGVGATMLMYCDVNIASTRARLRFPFVNLGLVPEAASSVLLPLIVGVQRASEWLLLGDFVDAESAFRGGLVNRLVEPETLEAESLRIAQKIAVHPPEAVRLTKELIRGPLRASLGETMQKEGTLFVERLRSPEAMEAFMRFFTKA